MLKEIKSLNQTNLMFNSQRDNTIMSIAKVNQLRHVLAHTDKGDLTVGLNKGQTDLEYAFFLDAVPMSKEQNKDLITIFNE